MSRILALTSKTGSLVWIWVGTGISIVPSSTNSFSLVGNGVSLNKRASAPWRNALKLNLKLKSDTSPTSKSNLPVEVT
ncbi:MAG: hypothetical protein PHE32_04140 [Candidatus Shapirobacteria bacterium]|nr:hypothetical protein [Candidatus Shapirobacteria bacterium]